MMHSGLRIGQAVKDSTYRPKTRLLTLPTIRPALRVPSANRDKNKHHEPNWSQHSYSQSIPPQPPRSLPYSGCPFKMGG